MPDLAFQVVDVEAPRYAATPAIRFKVHIENRPPGPPEEIHTVLLKVQVHILTARRHYNGDEQEKLLELFGQPQRWGETLKSLFWTQTLVPVPRFSGSTVVDVDVPCSYDFEVANSKYLHALEEGDVPLEFLFGGTVFYQPAFGVGASGLRTAQISWDKEAEFRLPVAIWRQAMDHYFPNSAWLRIDRALFERLYRFKATRYLPTWEAALEQLLQTSEEVEQPWKP